MCFLLSSSSQRLISLAITRLPLPPPSSKIRSSLLPVFSPFSPLPSFSCLLWLRDVRVNSVLAPAPCVAPDRSRLPGDDSH
jgi:hypothetical protein